MVQTRMSTRFSFEGWDFKKWIKGNKEALKVIVPAVLALLATQNIVAAGALTIVGKAVLDIIDFYASEVKL